MEFRSAGVIIKTEKAVSVIKISEFNTISEQKERIMYAF